jgi:hypothetical protein
MRFQNTRVKVVSFDGLKDSDPTVVLDRNGQSQASFPDNILRIPYVHMTGGGYALSGVSIPISALQILDPGTYIENPDIKLDAAVRVDGTRIPLPRRVVSSIPQSAEEFCSSPELHTIITQTYTGTGTWQQTDCQFNALMKWGSIYMTVTEGGAPQAYIVDFSYFR